MSDSHINIVNYTVHVYSFLSFFGRYPSFWTLLVQRPIPVHGPEVAVHGLAELREGREQFDVVDLSVLLHRADEGAHKSGNKTDDVVLDQRADNGAGTKTADSVVYLVVFAPDFRGYVRGDAKRGGGRVHGRHQRTVSAERRKHLRGGDETVKKKKKKAVPTCTGCSSTRPVC